MTVLANRVFQQDLRIVTPDHVLLAVEIESPSSLTTDRITKPAQYAAGGIVHFWRLETRPLQLHTYRLTDGVYTATGSWGVEDIARIREPFGVDIDLAALLPD